MSDDIFTIVKRRQVVKRGTTGSNDPKPCPTCYAEMRWDGKAWQCARHGEPTRP